MTPRFIGKTTNKIDDKLRVSIPSAFRRVLSDGNPDREPGKPATVYLILDERDGVVEGMTAEEYEARSVSIDAEPDPTLKRLLEIRHFSFAVAMTLDANGRIQVTPQMRKLLGECAALTFAGENRTFQILPAPAEDEGTPDAIRSEYEALLASLPAGMNLRNYAGRSTAPRPTSAPET